MTQYIKTSEIYAGSNCIRICAKHNKDKGRYEIVADAVSLKNEMISKSFDKEYYNFYYDLVIVFCEALRKSKKKQEEADAYIKENKLTIAQKFIELCAERGGKNILILE